MIPLHTRLFGAAVALTLAAGSPALSQQLELKIMAPAAPGGGVGPHRRADRRGAPRRAAEEYVVRPTSVSLLVSPGPPRSVVGPLSVDQTHLAQGEVVTAGK